MKKRLFCLLCAVMMVVFSVMGIRGAAIPAVSTAVMRPGSAEGKPRSSLKAYPLIPAMLAVLTGVILTSIFDKKK